MNTAKDAAVITAVGLASLGFFGWPVLMAWRARRWPEVDGEVQTADLVRSGSKSARLRVQVRYAFRVATQDYSSERVSFFDSTMLHGSRDAAEVQLRRYAKSSHVPVRYNPAKPQQAVIETGVPWTFYFALAASMLFVVGGAVGLLRWAM
jgi:hypothetical protein